MAIVNAADELLAYGKLAEAKAKYQEAVTLDGTKPYPKGKIEDINVKKSYCEGLIKCKLQYCKTCYDQPLL